MEILVKRKEVDQDDTGYFYIDIGPDEHDCCSFRLWINPWLVRKDKDGKHFVTFPVEGKVVRMKNGNLILRPEKRIYTYNIYIPCGCQENSFFIVEGEVKKFPYEVWASPQGRLGISTGALVLARGPIIVHWEKSGRLYGKPAKGSCIITPTGEVEEIIADLSVCDL